MKKCVFVTYGTSQYAGALTRIRREATATRWFTDVRVLGPADIPSSYRNSLKEILNCPKGGGYWIWKPLILREQLRRLSNNDILVYADAGCHVNKKGDFARYLGIIEGSPFGSLSFEMAFIKEQWTHPRVFEHFSVACNDTIRTSGQYIATILPFRVCDRVRELVEVVCDVVDNDPLLFTDLEIPTSSSLLFQQCRHDQSIWSVAKKKLGTTAIPDETWSSDWATLINVPIQARRLRSAESRSTKLRRWFKSIVGLR